MNAKICVSWLLYKDYCENHQKIRWSWIITSHRKLRDVMPHPDLNLTNSLRTRQNRHHFADDIFKDIYFNENVLISIRNSIANALELRLSCTNPSICHSELMSWMWISTISVASECQRMILKQICISKIHLNINQLLPISKEYTITVCIVQLK